MRMNLENAIFQDHCQSWHQSTDCNRLPQQRPIYTAPHQKNWEFGDNRWRHGDNRLYYNNHKITTFSNFSSSCHIQQSKQGLANVRYRESFNHSISDGSNRLRRTLIDTFVERNDEYWKSRVTIKIDVAWTDHSHVIGKQGRNTQNIMKDTGCHIHFPDSNRHPDMEKSNMVSIAGPLKSVDKARQGIRDLAPLVVTLETKIFIEDHNALAEDPVFKEICASYGLNVLVRTNRSSGTPFFVVRGSVHQTNEIRDVVTRLQQHFLRTTKAVCSTSIDVLKPQQPIVLGPNGANMNLISQRTGATIYYPQGNVGSPTTIFIQGSIESILSARRHIIGCLPMSFAFDLPTERSNPVGLEELQNEFGVSIALRVSRNTEPQMIIVKGQERQATAMYAVRQRLLGGEETILASDYDFMKDFDTRALRPAMDGNGAAADALMPIATGTSLSTFQFAYNPFSITPFSPLLPPVPFPFVSNMNDQRNHVGRWSSSSGCIGFQNTTKSDQPSTSHIPAVENSVQARSESVQPKPPSVMDPVPEEAPLATGLLQAAKKIQETENSDWKAPGNGRNIITDYERRQILATKAMRQNPNGPRCPTDDWSGLGFSRSMPSAVRAQLAKGHSGIRSERLDEETEVKKDPNECVPANPKPKKVFNCSTYFDCGAESLGNINIETDDVSTLLFRLRLAKYVDIFREQEVDMGTLLSMTDTDLMEMGVNTFGARRKLVMAISELKETHRRSR